jgi:hypothetical protein
MPRKLMALRIYPPAAAVIEFVVARIKASGNPGFDAWRN